MNRDCNRIISSRAELEDAFGISVNFGRLARRIQRYAVADVEKFNAVIVRANRNSFVAVNLNRIAAVD